MSHLRTDNNSPTPLYDPPSINNHDSNQSTYSTEVNNVNILSLNCRSIRSLFKQGELLALIEEHNADIIIGCESHIDQSFPSSEIFPPNFTVYRKDRSIGGGGVFLCFNNSLNVLDQPNLQTDAELVWAKLHFRGRQPIYICSFYRPPDNSLNALIQLRQSLDLLSNESTVPFIILAGDFNLPDITWNDGHGLVNPSPAYGVDVNTYFLDTIDDHSLEQLVNFPTRNDHTLDLILTTLPEMLADVATVPGMSDHEAITFSLKYLIPQPTKTAHKVYLYHKGDIEAIKEEIIKFQEQFIHSDPYDKSVEENWRTFN